MECFNDKLLSPETRPSQARGHIRPNISEQLRPSLSLITSPVIMTWIIVGPGRLFPLVKIWVCLRAYRTSHRGWIKSCSLSGRPSRNLTSSSQSHGEINRSGDGLIQKVPPPHSHAPGNGACVATTGPRGKSERSRGYWESHPEKTIKNITQILWSWSSTYFHRLKVFNGVNYLSTAKRTKKKTCLKGSSNSATASVFASAC